MRTCTSVLIVLLLAVTALGAGAYTGTLSAPAGLDGTGFWVNDPQDPQTYPGWAPASITWDVTWNPQGWWHYSYTLTVYRAEISHFILETSPNFSANDIMNATGQYGSTAIGDYSIGAGNPFMPGAIYGIKFDETYGTTLTLNFDSYRMPVWGDFYAKCGAVGGTQNTVWNKGLTSPDTDPMDPIDSGSIGYHILVPDTVVPEPSSMMALGAGLVGLAGFVSRRRR